VSSFLQPFFQLLVFFNKLPDLVARCIVKLRPSSDGIQEQLFDLIFRVKVTVRDSVCLNLTTLLAYNFSGDED